MKIAVVSWLFPSRAHPTNGVFVKAEIDRLAAAADIRLIAPLHNQFWFGGDHAYRSEAGYPVVRPFTLLFPTWFFQRLSPPCMARSLSRMRPFIEGCDLVHAHNCFPDAVAAVRAFGREFPVVATLHGGDVNIQMARPDLRGAVTEALNRCRLVICVSRALETTLRGRGVSAATTVIPNGIDTALFSPGDKREARRILGLDPDRPLILYAGNFVPWKGIEFLIGALPQVLRAFPECELALVGARAKSGDCRRYDDLVRSLGMERSVRVRCWIPADELSVWMRAADVFALPSLAEGFGIVAAEALACGTPVVATRSGGPEDIVTGGLGALVPPGDSGALADALVGVLRGEGLSGPGERVRSARERFSHETVTRMILDAYERALSMR